MPKLTIGDHRVRLSFNPSTKTAVTAVKKAIAKEINNLYSHKSDDPEARRYLARAATALEDACMHAVKFYTHPASSDPKVVLRHNLLQKDGEVEVE